MKSDKKIIVVGSDDLAYHICFLSMITLQLKEVYLIPSSTQLDNKMVDLQYASKLFSMSELKIGNEKDYAAADILILTARETRLENEQESDYIRRNILLVRKIINQAMASGFNGLILVANELNDLFTYLVWKFSGLPKYKIFGIGTYIDTVYFQKLLSDTLEVSFCDIKGYIIGGRKPMHKTVAWSRSSIGGNSLLGLIMDPSTTISQESILEIEEKLSKQNQINEDGDLTVTTSTAVLKLVQFILTNEKAVVPLVHLMDIGEIKDIPLSIPVLLGENGIRQISGLNFSEMEQKELLTTAKEIRSQLDWIEQG
ncbi:lactate/malate family dehydrogenase [Carnobacterium pleistocenium]|uniref:lactate/malate family dehydrogenase n=1 Tax=Carnobacterium pleistocenium TaxID=181073 RepID=UPI000553FD6E|nr:lactate dehydrogenase [Carnobacterium pleistocenium]